MECDHCGRVMHSPEHLDIKIIYTESTKYGQRVCDRRLDVDWCIYCIKDTITKIYKAVGDDTDG